MLPNHIRQEGGAPRKGVWSLAIQLSMDEWDRLRGLLWCGADGQLVDLGNLLRRCDIDRGDHLRIREDFA